jgi:hypothetical protein
VPEWAGSGETARASVEKERLVGDNASETAGHKETNAKRCADCGLEYLPLTRRGDTDDRIDKFFGLDIVSALNIVMDLIHASHARSGMSEGAFAAWNWLAGLRQMLGPEQASARQWANEIAQLRADLIDFAKAAARQESLETLLVAQGGQTPVVRTRSALQLASELATELAALEHLWKKPSRAIRPSKHTLGLLELKLHKVGFSHEEIARADFDGSLDGAASERAVNVAVERVKKRIKAAEKHEAEGSTNGMSEG